MAVLYLVRHAIAAERGPEYPKDDERPLTKTGKSRMKDVVAGWRTLDPELDLILTSPLVRAHSTAEIIRDGFKGKVRLDHFPVLAPGHRPAEVAAELARLKKVSAVALVGHEPDLGMLAAWLIGAREAIPFKKGGIARIDAATLPPKHNGRLIWLATPRMLRRLA